jgi:hypothetical protein
VRLAYRDGGRICVLRPATTEAAQRAAREAREAAERNDVLQLEGIAARVGEFVFLGYVARNRPIVVDAQGRRVGPCVEGDLLIEEKRLEETQRTGTVAIMRSGGDA